jgi:hypothetical protein
VLGEFTESFLRDWSPDHYKIKLGNTFFNDWATIPQPKLFWIKYTGKK